MSYRLYVSTPDRTFTSHYATESQARAELTYYRDQCINTDWQYLLELAQQTADDEWQVIVSLRDC